LISFIGVKEARPARLNALGRVWGVEFPDPPLKPVL
jgi:hypothetical protein